MDEEYEYNDNYYPFIDYLADEIVETDEDDELPIYKEIAWNFEKNIPILINNTFKIVEKNDAIAVWIYHAIKTQRYVYSIYSWDFGSEIETLISKKYTREYTKAEAERYIKEALLINPYILDITQLEVDFKGSTLDIKLNVETVYSEMEVNFIV